MNLIEFLGFLALMLFMMSSGRNRKRQEMPEEEDDSDEQEQAERLREFLQGVKSDMKKVATLPPPPPSKPIVQETKWEHHEPTPQPIHKEVIHQKPHKPPKKPLTTPSLYVRDTDATHDPYAINRNSYEAKERPLSKGQLLRKRLISPQEMILWREILGPPTAYRNDRSKYPDLG